MRSLSIITLGYIVLPTVLFLATWVDVRVAILSITALLGAFIYAVRQVLRPGFSEEPGFVSLNRGLVVSAVVISFLMCLISEFGIFPFKSFDHIAHNYKFHLLSTQPLPLFDTKYSIYTCYYLGFYMVPSMIGRLTGLESVSFFAFIWVWIGMFLSITWINSKLLKGHVKWFVYFIVFILVYPAGYINSILPLVKYLFRDEFIYNNAIHLNQLFVLNQVPVFTRNLSESVQHALPGILSASLLIGVPRGRGGLAVICLFIFGSVFWSPFATIGMVFFVLFRLVKEFRKYDPLFLAQMAGYGFLLVASFGPVLLFLLGSDSTDQTSNRFIWQSGIRTWFLYYLLYLFSFFGVWILILRNALFELDKETLSIALFSLAWLGWFQMGYFNDLNIRASIVPMVILGVCVAHAVWHRSEGIPLYRKVVLFLVLFLSYAGMGKFYYERFFLLKKDYRFASTIASPHLADYGHNYYDFLKKGYGDNGEEAVRQYSLKKGSFFEKHLLRVNRVKGHSDQ